MLRKVIGYFFAGIGFLGFGYFKVYKGDIIPYPMLWYLLCIAICIFGWYLISSSKKNKNSQQEKHNADRLARLKQSGEKIVLNLDNCEVRENSYYEEKENESMSKSQMIDASINPNRNFRHDFVIQSAIIYYYKSGDIKIKMPSQSFPFGSEIMSSYIERGLVTLFVNRFDKNDFVFDLKS